MGDTDWRSTTIRKMTWASTEIERHIQSTLKAWAGHGNKIVVSFSFAAKLPMSDLTVVESAVGA